MIKRACALKTALRRKEKMDELKMLVDNLAANAQKIANTKLEDVINDVDQLTVALCTSNLNVVAQTLSLSREGENRYIAAHKALDIGWNPSIRDALAKDGYFTKGLRELLELAERDPVAGSRLMPIFEEAVDIHKDLRIPKDLKCRLKNYTSEKLETDGFAISNPDDDGKVSIKTARWVEEKISSKEKPM